MSKETQNDISGYVDRRQELQLGKRVKNLLKICSADRNFNVSSTLVHDQIPVELMTFPWASAGLCV